MNQENEGSLIGLGSNFGRSNGWNIPFAKVADLVSLGALFGPGAPDPDLLKHVKTCFYVWQKAARGHSLSSRILNISLYVWQKAAREHATDYWTLDAGGTESDTFLANRPSHWTISRQWSVVSCVRCGCVGAGLGFPVGDSRFAPVFTPNLRFKIHKIENEYNLGNSICFVKILSFAGVL